MKEVLRFCDKFQVAIQVHIQVQPVTLRYVETHSKLCCEAALFTGDITLVASVKKVMAGSRIQATAHFGRLIAPQGQTRKSLAGQAHENILQQLLLSGQGLS